jgi:hypothetical protein
MGFVAQQDDVHQDKVEATGFRVFRLTTILIVNSKT